MLSGRVLKRMVPLNASELKRTAVALEEYDAKSAIAQIGALLTVPELQANTMRVETLVHLAVAHCQGSRILGLTEIDRWLNNWLRGTWVARLEDPAEDVFVTNVETPQGNRRVFEGIWESNDYFVQIVIDVLDKPKVPQECRTLLIPALALLALSDSVAERVGLQRWHSEPSIPCGTVRLPTDTQVADRASEVTFTASDLSALGINRDTLAPFILRDEDKRALASETIGHSSLERHPLVEFDDDLVLALPPAVSPAIRRFVVTELKRRGYCPAFSNALAVLQAQQVEKDGLRELQWKADSLTPPEPDGNIPSLHSWLLKYDIDKYLHVVLLHDHMDRPDAQNLSGFMEYPEEQRAGLEKYLNQVSSHCQSVPGFGEGTTLLVRGGLGGDFGLRFEDWPDQWPRSFIGIPDLLMLNVEVDRPVARYLKCIKQKTRAEEKGVSFQNINGDYNFYCFWRRQNYRLVPRELPLTPGSMLSIGTDFVLPVRQEMRNRADRHVIQTTTASYVPVLRLAQDTYFKSLQDRPVYVSLAHLRVGSLAGAVETRRGPSWFTVKPRAGGEDVRHFLYKIWNGFVDLYGRLVFEIETVYPKATAGAIEIRLNCDDVVVPENSGEFRLGETVGNLAIAVDPKQRIAEVRFPSEFFRLFQQPETIGERLVLRSITEGMIGLYQETKEDIEESDPTALVQRVIGDSPMRVLHVFQTHYPHERLLTRQGSEPIFLAHEDIGFSRLRLSEGCTSAVPGTSIVSKTECNIFLHCVVDKVWDRLRDRLQQFDRASVIRKVLAVQESAIQDRDSWGRTAQALLALYTSTDDVHAIAQERESDRINVSLAARTILEMAICECSSSGGRQLSRWALDELLAESALLIEVATDSDAVNSGLAEPSIQLHENGEYTIDRSYRDTVIKPFVTAYYREEFETAAGEYSELYRKRLPGKRMRIDEMFPSEFISAFQAEFGLTPDEAVDGFAELMDLAVECDSVVVETTLGNIRTRLTTRRGLTPDACKAFIRTFSIFHRPAWNEPPPGFATKDLYPWRFNCKLSAAVRPVLVFGEQDDDPAFFGAGAFKLGCGYLLEKSEQGHLPQEFFTSAKMKQYIGAVNDKKGHAFACTVADQMRENGWQVRGEVQMTELGASADLGDVDVLAWKPSGEIRLIECKRLHFARTVDEVAKICHRFQGEAKDELDKHLQRVKWIKANPTCFQQIIEFNPNPDRIDDRFVTSTHVPSKYLESLPIQADKIGPLDTPLT